MTDDTKLNVNIPGLFIICGLQGGGKSHLIRYFMYEHRKDFDWGLVITNTGFADGNFDYIDKKFIHIKYDENVLKNLKRLQKKFIAAGKKPSGFVIFDDALFGKQWRSNEFLSLITQLRHYNITCILSCQYPNAILPVYRTNAFQVAMFTMPTKAALVALYESYGQLFDSYADFKQFLLSNTGNHCFVLYNARNGTATIEGRYGVYRCPAEIPDFKIKPRKKF